MAGRCGNGGLRAAGGFRRVTPSSTKRIVKLCRSVSGTKAALCSKAVDCYVIKVECNVR
jgi:hypothetical protein